MSEEPRPRTILVPTKPIVFVGLLVALAGGYLWGKQAGRPEGRDAAWVIAEQHAKRVYIEGVCDGALQTARQANPGYREIYGDGFGPAFARRDAGAIIQELAAESAPDLLRRTEAIDDSDDQITDWQWTCGEGQAPADIRLRDPGFLAAFAPELDEGSPATPKK